MYITINDNIYPNIKRLHNQNTIVYVGEALTDISSVDGLINVYSNDGFPLCVDEPAAYLRTVINEGSVQLTNVPEGYIPPPTTEQRVTELENTMNVLLGVSE